MDANTLAAIIYEAYAAGVSRCDDRGNNLPAWSSFSSLPENSSKVQAWTDAANAAIAALKV